MVFTTIQKFMPEEKGGKAPLLSERRDIVVIGDEAHRSQYDLIDGLARNLRDSLPHASFIGFTGTPIEKTDANTRAVFGDYISIYDIQRAVADKATVPIYYESRVAKLGLNQSELPKIDEEFEAITEGEELTRKEKLKTKWAALEALVGNPKRIDLDIPALSAWHLQSAEVPEIDIKVSTRIRFNERKATQAAAHLLRLRGGRMSYLKLIKLLYLADREALLRWGRPISTDRYVSMDRGPVLSRVLDLATDGDAPGTPSIWAANITAPGNYEVELKGDAGDDELSEAEVEVLNAVFAEHGRKSRWDLVKLTHALPEWIDPRGGAVAIAYRDILKAGGKSDLEIAAIEEELAELAETDLLLAPC